MIKELSLIYENYSRCNLRWIKRVPSGKKHEVNRVRDLGKSSANDVDIRAHSRKHGMVLVTQDKESADIALRNGINCILVSLGDIAELVDSKILQGLY